MQYIIARLACSHIININKNIIPELMVHQLTTQLICFYKILKTQELFPYKRTNHCIAKYSKHKISQRTFPLQEDH